MMGLIALMLCLKKCEYGWYNQPSLIPRMNKYLTLSSDYAMLIGATVLTR